MSLSWDFFSTFSPGQPPLVIFDYADFIADSIHYQLTNLQLEGVFRYTSYIFHLFLFFQSESFPISLQKLDIEGKPLSVVFWTSVLRKESTKFSYSKFVELFVHPVTTMLTET